MTYARFSIDERPEHTLEARVLTTVAEKLKGLLGTDDGAGTVVLTKCASVHSFGMGYDLDLAFVGERGEVLDVRRGMGPGEVASCGEATCVFERPSAGDEWINEGEHLWITAICA